MARPHGKCHICGEAGPLSKEHIPPQAAYNDGRYYVLNALDALKRFSGEKVKEQHLQGGFHRYTLCEQCNNNTGAWYGPAYIDWANEGIHHLISSNGNPTLYYIHHGYPLRIIKEVVAMFLSANNPDFADAIPYLRKFVLNKEVRGLPPEIRICCYYANSGKGRMTGMMTWTEGTSIRCLSEDSHIPYGYVMAWKSPPKERRLIDITHFSEYRYGDLAHFQLKLASLPVHLPFPGDFRTAEEIEQDRQANLQLTVETPSPDQVQEFRETSYRAVCALANLGVSQEHSSWVTSKMPKEFLD